MNFFNRAIKNITRKVSKSILLIVTFFVIGNFVIIGLSVAKASESAKTLTRQKMRAVVNYEIDYNAFYNDADQIEDEDERNEFYKHYPNIKISEIKELLKDERVKTANAITSNMWFTTEGGIDFVHLNNTVEQEMDSNGQSCYYDMDSGEEICETYVNPSFFIKGNFLPSMIEFEDGDYKVVAGNFYSQANIDNKDRVCLISSALAQTNGLSIGDSIKIAQDNVNSSWNQKMDITEDDVNVELEVIGIYEHNNPITPDAQNYDYTYPYENLDNMILVPTSTINDITYPVQIKSWNYYKEQFPDDAYYQDEENAPKQDALDNLSVGTTVILLNDPLEVDGFVEDYKNSVEKYKKISVNNEEFKKLSKPLDTLSDYAQFIVGLVVVNAIVIITLVTALTLKTREYEIGVLLSIGASKLKVILQFFVELAVVALIGFTLAVGSGSLISKKVGTSLLDNQIQSAGLNEEENEDYYEYNSIWDDNYETEISLDDIIAEYDVTVSPFIIGEIYIVGLGIVLISVIIPSFMIMRYNPKKILMNQG